MDVCGCVKISDFGTAECFQAAQEDEQYLFKDEIGTIPYMAPEVIAQKTHDGRKADMWSCGIILALLVSGNFPWEEASDKNAAFQKFEQTGGWGFNASPELRDLLSKLMIVDANERSSADEILRHPWLETCISKLKANAIYSNKSKSTSSCPVAFDPLKTSNIISTQQQACT